MKLLKREFDDDSGGGAGQVTLLAESAEDLWHAYNLLQAGDYVRAPTFRKVSRPTSGGLGSSSERIKLTLTVRVQGEIDFDPDTPSLRLKGTNVTENEYVKMHQYHSLELVPGVKFTLGKAHFDAMHHETLRVACDPAATADVVAVVMEEGLAQVCLVTPTMTLLRARVQVQIPKKAGRATGYGQRDRAVRKFYEQVLAALLQHTDFNVVKCVVLASPGFVKDDFFAYLMEEAQRRELRPLLENRERFALLHASSGHKQALQEVLASNKAIADTKSAAEARALDAFFEMFNEQPARAFYGPTHVRRAAELDAVQTLLITDSLFRSRSVAERKHYVELVQSVKASGGRVHVFSSSHSSGEQLADISGIAAVLRFPLPELEELQLDGDEAGGAHAER